MALLMGSVSFEEEEERPELFSLLCEDIVRRRKSPTKN